MPEFKDYNLLYQRVNIDGGKPQLRVVLQTAEFGPMESRIIDAVADEALNEQLLGTLADDVIDEYELRLSRRPVVVQGWK